MAFRGIGFALLVGVLVASFSACSRPDQVAEKPAAQGLPSPATAVEPTGLTYADVIAHLEAEGRTIGEAAETYAKMMGAQEGWRVNIDGHPFEIYVFELESHEGQLAFRKVKNEGVLGFQAEIYGNLAFFRSTKDPHPEFLTLVESIRAMK